ncbi:MAG TPA: SGNH/GDSL hydrolase family protein [Pelomicrobium sp.]|nr:SGNH/GDSL hydrolase family protein [Pelomicrobium sp.]
MALSLALPAGAAQPAPALRVVFFGDSLVDSGNVYRATRLLGLNPAFPPSTPPYRRYWEGRFSNGPNVADFLAARVCGEFSTASLDVLDRVAQTCAVNFAFGGATAGFWERSPASALGPGFRAQTELYASALGSRAGRGALHVVWVGADDYLYVSPAPPPQTVVGNITAGLRDLYELGARRFAVIDLPDLGRVPMAAGTPAAARMTQLTDAHNRLLEDAVLTLNATLPGIDVRLVRVSALAKALGMQPRAGPAAGCLERFLRLAAACRSLEDVLFYSRHGLPPPQGFFCDELHPTTEAHRRVFVLLERTIAAPRS